jgi:nucleotide-binding universal stress UspA family protein
MNEPADRQRPGGSTAPKLIAVGADGSAESRDATVLGTVIARATDGELMLVAVHADPILVMPSEINWTGQEEQADEFLRELRDDLAPNARADVETDWSVARALERVVRREHRDLVVLGSSPHAPEGHLRIGDLTRQQLGDAQCALAVAPRGLGAPPQSRLATIGVGYDGGQESHDALARAGALAVAAGAKLRVRAVVDDRLPRVGPRHRHEATRDERVDAAVGSLRELAEQAGSATGAEVQVEVGPGSPADELRQLSTEVDLVVIGSRRWGAAARVLLGSTREELMHDASSAVMVVPRLGA